MPKTAIQKTGAVTPSDVFSATVSTAAFMMPSLSSTEVSRPTIMETLCLAPSTSPRSSASYTFMLSCLRLFAASMSQHITDMAARHRRRPQNSSASIPHMSHGMIPARLMYEPAENPAVNAAAGMTTDISMTDTQTVTTVMTPPRLFFFFIPCA